MNDFPAFGTIPHETLISLSGLEVMEAMRDGRLPGPLIARHLGYSVHSVGPGRVSFRGTPTADVLNPMGTVHGGWYGTLLDSAMGCAVMTMLPSGIAYTTLEYKVNVVRALRIGIEIEAVGEVQHVGRSTGVASGEIRDAEGRLYATGSTTCLILRA